MTLEEMTTVWSEMTEKLENQKQLTDKLIMDMTHQRYNNKIGVISKYESAGAVICFVFAILLLMRLDTFDTWYLQACAIFTVAYFLVLPAVVIKTIYNMKRINIRENNYKQTLIDFTKRRKQFLKTQRIGIYLNFVLLIVSLPVFIKLMNGKNLFIENTTVWYWYLPLMGLFLILFSRWGYKAYKNITASAENLLRDLEN